MTARSIEQPRQVKRKLYRESAGVWSGLESRFNFEGGGALRVFAFAATDMTSSGSSPSAAYAASISELDRA